MIAQMHFCPLKEKIIKIIDYKKTFIAHIWLTINRQKNMIFSVMSVTN